LSDEPEIKHRLRILIFRSALLPISETFVWAQAEALRAFEPIYAGLTRVSSGLPRSAQTILLSEGKGLSARISKWVYQVSGYGPGFEARVKQAEPVLIHAHFAVDGTGALSLARLLKLPLIVSLHGYDVATRDSSFRRSLSGRLYLARRERLWEQAALFLCVSEFVRRKAVEAGFPEEKLLVHYTGVDVEQFRELALERDGSVLFVGRLVDKKGCGYLLEAMASVCRSHPATRLTVVGDGPLRAELESHAARLHLPAEFLGAQTPSAVRERMARASIFCVPSVAAENGDSEGFGMVFAEAQAMGTPVVSFRHGGVPEAVADGVTGLLVPERATTELALALSRLLSDSGLWRSFSSAGVARIGKELSLAGQTRRLESIYASVAQGGVRRGKEAENEDRVAWR
jgi:glycosyltransferase involved in cell wall biosynthesis